MGSGLGRVRAANGLRHGWSPARLCGAIILAQDVEVAGDVLVKAEVKAQDLAGCVVYGAVQGEQWAAASEPVEWARVRPDGDALSVRLQGDNIPMTE